MSYNKEKDEYFDERERTRREREQDRDVVLNYRQFCWVLDKTNGEIILYRGPYKLSLANTQVLVISSGEGDFVEVLKSQGIQRFIQAKTDEYIILKNPIRTEQATRMGNNQPVELETGKRVVIPGPRTFPLWPGQEAEVIPGHLLKKDEYLVVQVYDEVVEGTEEVQVRESDGEHNGRLKEATSLRGKPIGAQAIITGEFIRFYIPPTGVEVLKDHKGEFIRKAVRLSDMHYCAIMDEKGQVHYHRGPGVIFPASPYQKFIAIDNERIFPAYTLTKNSGIHLLVIKGFDRETGNIYLPMEFRWPEGKDNFEPGEEIVIKGIDCIFFPFDYIKVIGTIAPVPISDGEGIYVRDKDTGKIKVVKGPLMFVPDPRHEEHIRRDMDKETSELYRGEAVYVRYGGDIPPAGSQQAQDSSYRSDREIIPGSLYDPDKAVAVYVPMGMAVMVVGIEEGSIRRRVVLGPDRLILNYNEKLEILTLSTGKPKTTDCLIKTCFLLVSGNKVSDIINLETADHCPAQVTVSFRVSFEGEPEQWFNVSNYVKLLSDNMRSRIAGEAKRHGIERFFNDYTNIIRDCVLGKKEEGKPRLGRIFEENGMRVYDAEILDFEIIDEELKFLLIEAQQNAIKMAVANQQEQNKLEAEKVKQDVILQINQKKFDTENSRMELEKRRADKQYETDVAKEKQTKELELMQADREKQAMMARAFSKKEGEKIKNEILLEEAEIIVKKNSIIHDEEIQYKERLAGIDLKKMEAGVEAVVRQNQSVSPQFIQAMQTLGDKNLAAEFSKNLNLYAAMKGTNIAEVAGLLLTGLPHMDNVLSLLQRTP